MKNMKRVLAALLSVAMLLAMAVPAFAAATVSYTISTASGDTHTYTVYQILTGTLADDNETALGNVVAGSNFKTANGKGTDGANLDAAGAAAYFKALTGTDQEKADAIAEFVDFTGNAYGTVSSSSSLSNVPTGYYLIKDTTQNMPEGDSYSTSVVKVVNNVTISPKKGTVTFEKKVMDVNDTTGVKTGWQDSADYDIGDKVPFQLTGTLPANYGDYDTYYYQFTDQMEKTLTFGSDEKATVKVYVKNGDTETELTSGFVVSDGSTVSSSDDYNGGTTFTVTFNDLKSIEGATINKDSKIIVRYSATLNENANIGAQGNLNEAKLKYSNNPNNGGEGSTGETPWDANIVFTYKTVVNKVDSSKAELVGAAFSLTKLDSNDNEMANTTKIVNATWDETNKKYVITDASKTSFEFKGLDDGKYVLKEIVTPSGYNTAADIYITINADHTATWDGSVRTGVLTKLNENDNVWTGNVSAGSVTGTVVNNKGSELPETGGIGTTIFYVVGGCMMFGAAVLLITKKRMENQ